MLATERQDRILEILRKEKAAKVSRLSQAFQVSEMTVRRDLLKMEQAGMLKRTFGGAVAAPIFSALQLSLAEKQAVNAAEKMAIGLTAAKLIEAGETIALNAGTTTLQVAKYIPEVENLTVVTNAINIAMELADRSDIQLLVVGGSLNKRSIALVGPLAEAALDQIHINKLYLGATGVSTENGVTTMSLLEASLYRAMIEIADEVIVLADHTKLGRSTLAPIVTIHEVSKLITDAKADIDYLEQLRRLGVKIVIAEPKIQGA